VVIVLLSAYPIKATAVNRDRDPIQAPLRTKARKWPAIEQLP
jgi:hypothetical protein